MIQKTAFLVQMKGVATNYRYRLHFRGPYSEDLNLEAFRHQAEFESPANRCALDRNEQSIVDEFGEIFEFRPNQMEVAATYAFYVSYECLDPLNAYRKTREFKSTVPAAQFALGISRAKQFLYPPADEEIREMRDEFAPWQEASLEVMGRYHD